MLEKIVPRAQLMIINIDYLVIEIAYEKAANQKNYQFWENCLKYITDHIVHSTHFSSQDQVPRAKSIC